MKIWNNFSAFLLHGGTQIALFLWQPNPDNEILFYVFAAMWGMGDAVIQTQINGIMFKNILSFQQQQQK